MTTYNTSKGPIEVRNPQWNTTSTIDCEILHKDYGWIPFTATSYDELDYGRELYEQLSDVAAPVDSDALYQEQVREAAERRAIELKSSDWTQLFDVPQATKDLWAPYRQALRDITAQTGYPNEITWPTPPA